jgi:hypothetical protein
MSASSLTPWRSECSYERRWAPEEPKSGSSIPGSSSQQREASWVNDLLLPICTRFSKSCQIKRNIELIHGLPLKEETKEKILGGNAVRVLGLGSNQSGGI